MKKRVSFSIVRKAKSAINKGFVACQGEQCYSRIVYFEQHN